MASIFTKIILGEIPSYKVAENEEFYAFLDINPLAAGHTLVVPRHETDYLFAMSDCEYEALFLFAKKVALAIESVVPCKRIGMSVIGLEVPHAHIHLIPLNTMDDINFSRKKPHFEADEFQSLAEKIHKAFSEMPS